MTDESFAKLPIFAGMSRDERQQLLSLTERVPFATGEKIVTQNSQVQNLWFILTGECEIIRHMAGEKELKLAKLGPEAMFGEIAFFHAAAATADVVALSDMELLRLSREAFDRLVAQGNMVAYKLALNSVEQIADHLHVAIDWITELVTKEGAQSSASEWASFRDLVFRGL